MALYGLVNKVLNEIAITLMNNQDFAKLVYYKDATKNDSVLEMPDVENPISKIYMDSVFISRRIPTVTKESDVYVLLMMENYQSDRHSTTKIKGVTVRIKVIVHYRSLYTMEGNRDVSIVAAIENILENCNTEAIGKIKASKVTPLYEVPPEFQGYDIYLTFDGFGNTK